MGSETAASSRFAVDPAAAAAMGPDELRHHLHTGGLSEPHDDPVLVEDLR